MIKSALAVLLLLSFGSVSHQYLTSSQKRFIDAQDGSVDAQLALANRQWQQGNKTPAYYWWERSARNGSVKSIHYLMKHFPRSSPKWLKLAAETGVSAAIDKLAKRQLASSDMTMENWVVRWQQDKTVWLKRQLDLLEHFENNPRCDATLAVVGHSHSQKLDYVNVLSALNESQFELNWCSRWVVDPELKCAVQGERKRANCHADVVADYQILLAESGIASASKGKIILSEDSSKAVIQHEIAHWLGLADEYPMSGALAEHFCQGLYSHKSLNIVVTESNSDALSETDIKTLYKRLPWKDSLKSWRAIAHYNGQHWVLGSNDTEHKVGLYKADTCKTEKQFQAWKPVKETTAMEQHATEYWPEVYLQLIERQNETAN